MRALRYLALGSFVVVGCTESKGAVTGPAASSSANGQPSADGGTSAITDAGPNYPLVGALFMQAPIMSEMDNPTREQLIARDRGKEDKGPHRLGYLRRGAKVPVLPQPHVNAECKEGWYELVAGGFVSANT